MSKQISIPLGNGTYRQLRSRNIMSKKFKTVDEYISNLLGQVAKKLDKDERTAQKLSIEEKVEKAKEVIAIALEHYDRDKVVVAWTGGKDSTVLLWLVKQVCDEKGYKIPKCLFIDEGDVFDEIREFVDELTKKWKLDVVTVHNSNVSDTAKKKLGATIKVKDLNKRNQAEIERLGYDKDSFDYEPESFVGNHLMKTVPMNMYIEENKIAAFFEGIRWDEQEARAKETWFSQREETKFNSEHDRINSILHFYEKDIWEAIHKYAIPFCKLYAEGYRSLGARVTTGKTSDKPAWEQDLENTTERDGRRQDKEGLMKRLRDLGYM